MHFITRGAFRTQSNIYDGGFFAVTISTNKRFIVDIQLGSKCNSDFFRLKSTAGKVSAFGIFIVRIFPHLDQIRKDTKYLSLCIQSECGKIRTRKTPNTDTFYAVVIKRTGSVELQNNRFKVTKFLFNIPTLYPIKTPENPVIICQK